MSQLRRDLERQVNTHVLPVSLCVLQAEKTTCKAQLADRLVNGLSGENKRWSETIQEMDAAGGKLVGWPWCCWAGICAVCCTLDGFQRAGWISACCRHNALVLLARQSLCWQVGDVLLAAAFVSYAGPFNMTLRQQLVEQKWRPGLVERCIPLTDGVKPLDLLTGKYTCRHIRPAVCAGLPLQLCLPVLPLPRSTAECAYGLQMTPVVLRGQLRACRSTPCLLRMVQS